MSADPTAEHIDAVARVIDPAAFDVDQIDWLQRAVIEGPALDLLTSTDPAVRAALAASLPAEVMLAALVDRGALTEDAHCAHARAAQADGDYRSYTCEDAGTHCPPDRLVTPWKVAP